MRVALIVPPYDVIRDGYGSSLSIPGGVTPPLGLLSLAAVLRDQGHDVRIYDLCVEKRDREDLRREIQAFGVELLGLSVTTPAASSAADFVRRFARDAGIPFVIGGAHPTYAPGNIFREFPGALAAFRGEAEESFPRFLRSYLSPEDWGEIPGVMLPGREAESSCAYVQDPGALPLPAWDLVRLEAYAPLPSLTRHGKMAAVLSSRGCPYGRCTFCALGSVHAPPYRRMPPERVVKEMVRLEQDHGVREYVFWDDNFAVNAAWIGRFCRLLKEVLPGAVWSCTAKVDTVEQGMLDHMAQAGCFSILFGCESGEPRLLERLNKRITLEHMDHAVRICRRAHVEVRLSFMLTLPGETPREGLRTIRTAARLRPDVVNFFPYHPTPGTPLFEAAMREGHWVSDAYPLLGVHEVNYLSSGYRSPGQVVRLMKRGYLGVYLHPWNLVRRLNLLGSRNGRRTAWNGLRLLIGILLSHPVRRASGEFRYAPMLTPEEGTGAGDGALETHLPRSGTGSGTGG
jgi:radical SAM superfamily enzyme YgiQ (UPF0313 family)